MSPLLLAVGGLFSCLIARSSVTLVRLSDQLYNAPVRRLIATTFKLLLVFP